MEGHRIRELRLELTKFEYDNLGRDWFSKIYPSLIVLSLSANLPQQGGFCLPEIEVAPQPLLQHILITDARVGWYDTIERSTSLREVSVMFVAVLNFASAWYYAIECILGILAELPLLERLRIDEGLAPISTDYKITVGSTPSPPIKLPRLKSFHISGLSYLYAAVEISQAIAVHPACSVFHSCRNEEALVSMDEVVDLSVAVRQILPVGIPRRRVDEFIILTTTTDIRVWAADRSRSLENDTDGDVLNSVLDLQLFSIPGEKHWDICLGLCDLQDLSQVRILDVDTNALDMQAWIALLQPGTHLQILKVGERAGPSAVTALISAHATQSANSVPFPALKMLQLSFAVREEDSWALVTALKRRYTFGRGLKTLNVYKSLNVDFSECADEVILLAAW